jgi:transposase
MFIELTNATPVHKGKKIAIRKDLIATVHRGTITRNEGTSEEVTYVFAPPHGTWEVEETFDKVMLLMK